MFKSSFGYGASAPDRLMIERDQRAPSGNAQVLDLSASHVEKFIVGLDLGQAADFTAMVVLKKLQWAMPFIDAPYGYAPTHYHCPQSKRWPLNTAYTEIVEDVRQGFNRYPQLQGCDLVVDATGVGRPVVEMLRKANMPCQIRPVTITAGQAETANNGYWNVAKSILISGTNILLQQRRIGFAGKSENIGLIKTELQNYRMKISKAANEIFNAREGQHDDLVLALALAIWFGERANRRLSIG